MTDYELYLAMLTKAKHKIKVSTDKDNDLETDEEKVYNFIVTEDKVNGGIIAAKFELSGELVEIYLADACHTLDDF